MLSGKSAAQTRPTALGTMTQASTYGMTIPSIYGCIKSNLLAIWAQNLRAGGSSKKGKKKGVTTYIENIDFLIGSNPIQGCLQAWLNNNRYPLNFVKQRSALARTITVADPNFYAVVGVTAEVVLSGTFNDYGAQGTEAWGPTTYEYPLWNKALAGPDITNSSGARWWPYTFKWVSGDGPLLTFLDLTTVPAILPTNGFINIYYAQFSPISHNQPPIAFNRLTFEPQLGNGPEYASSGFPAQQIIYPEFAGLGSEDIDLGAAGLLPTIRVEVQGSHCLYSQGDADYFDMIEDVLKSGLMQVGSGIGLIHRGVNLNDLPGPVQKDFFQTLELSRPIGTFYQPNAVGSRLIAITRTRPFAGVPTIADTNGDVWNSVFLNTQKGVWYSNPCVGGPANGGNVVTCTPATGTGFNGDAYVLELDPSLDTLDNTATNTGTGTPAKCSITTTGNPSYIVAVVFCDDGILGNVTPPSWQNLFPSSISTWEMIFAQKVHGPGTYSINLPIGFGSNWWVVMVAFTQSKQAPYANALGDILDQKTAATARLACRAGGLFGSMSLDSQRTAADTLADLYACANAWPVWSGFRLKSIARSEVSAAGNGAVYTAPTASGPVMNIREDDLIGDKDGNLIQIVDKTPGIDEPNILQIEFLDRSSDYNPSVASWPENATAAIYGPKKGGASDDSTTGSPKVLHQIMDPLVARKLLAIQARRNSIVVPKQFKFKGKTQLQLLEPGDLVTVNDSFLGISGLAVRITSVSEDDKYGLDFEAELFSYGVHAPDPALVVTPTSGFQPNFGVVPASVNTPIFLEPVLRLSETTQPQLEIVVSDSDPNYGGCAVYISTDGGTSYNPIGQCVGNGITGVTTADWPIATDPDTTNDLAVDLTESLENAGVLPGERRRQFRLSLLRGGRQREHPLRTDDLRCRDTHRGEQIHAEGHWRRNEPSATLRLWCSCARH